MRWRGQTASARLGTSRGAGGKAFLVPSGVHRRFSLGGVPIWRGCGLQWCSRGWVSYEEELLGGGKASSSESAKTLGRTHNSGLGE